MGVGDGKDFLGPSWRENRREAPISRRLDLLPQSYRRERVFSRDKHKEPRMMSQGIDPEVDRYHHGCGTLRHFDNLRLFLEAQVDVRS